LRVTNPAIKEGIPMADIVQIALIIALGVGSVGLMAFVVWRERRGRA
jgi:hypothetical protein